MAGPLLLAIQRSSLHSLVAELEKEIVEVGGRQPLLVPAIPTETLQSSKFLRLPRTSGDLSNRPWLPLERLGAGRRNLKVQPQRKRGR